MLMTAKQRRDLQKVMAFIDDECELRCGAGGEYERNARAVQRAVGRLWTELAQPDHWKAQRRKLLKGRKAKA